MNPREFKEQLWFILNDFYPSKRHGTDLVSVRCPFCGDSVKSSSSTHFYIKINTENTDPILFICHRCNISGILTPSVLRSLEINDLSINSSLISYNKSTLKKSLSFKLKNNNLKFIIPFPDVNDKSNIMKLNYLRKRMGITLSFEDCIKLKTVFNFKDFILYNKIEELTVNKDKAINLNENYVGFLTAKNEFINFRQVKKCNYKRYEKYSIINKLDNTRKFYTIPNKIDILNNKNITINIAEGVFDIWGVYFNIYERDIDNMIYTAACGAGFSSVIKYFIKSGVFGNITLNIFSDDDKPPQFYKKLNKEISPWVNELTLFYNSKSKDFGVPKKDLRIIRKRI